jgi:hypothetical protein
MVYDEWTNELLEIQETNLEVETTMFKSTYEYSGHGAFVEFRTTI